MEQVDCLEPVLGVRAWEARSDGRLYSVFLPFKWRPSVNHAHCDPEGSSCSEDHKSPQSNCACGIYAYRDLDHRDLAFYERENSWLARSRRGVGLSRRWAGFVPRPPDCWQSALRPMVVRLSGGLRSATASHSCRWMSLLVSAAGTLGQRASLAKCAAR